MAVYNIKKSELLQAFKLCLPFGKAPVTLLQLKYKWNYHYAKAISDYIKNNWDQLLKELNQISNLPKST